MCASGEAVLYSSRVRGHHWEYWTILNLGPCSVIKYKGFDGIAQLMAKGNLRLNGIVSL